MTPISSSSRRVRPIAALLLALVLVLAACGNDDAQNSGAATKNADGTDRVVQMTPKQAAALIDETPDLVIVDVRTPEEFAEGHIPGAVNIDFSADDFVEQVGNLDPDAETLVYCRTGNRSSQAVAKMTPLGFSKIRHLSDGYVAWVDAGLPTEQ